MAKMPSRPAAQRDPKLGGEPASRPAYLACRDDHRMKRRVLEVSQILAWADAFHRRKGHWPRILSPRVPAMHRLSWRKIDNALRYGLCGLPGGSSLAHLLGEARGARNVANPPRLSAQQVLDWADAFFRNQGRWPTETSGSVAEAPGETWHGIDRALRAGVRGFPGGSSLARLLARYRGVRKGRSDDTQRQRSVQLARSAGRHT